MRPKPTRLFAAALLAVAVLISWPAVVWTQVDEIRLSDERIVLQADEVTYDQDRGVVTATGNVEISQGMRILLADRVTYNQRTDAVTASGNIVLREPSGDVIFADYLELQNQMRDGVVESIRVLLTDQSRFVANRGRRIAGKRTVLDKVVYSPCELCPDEPDRAPLWQIKAVKVIHDSETQTIEYRDAVLEFFGVPIAYTPIFFHPDPAVKRRTGLLAPIFRSSSELGLQVTTPFYWNIAPNRDATISPRFTSKEGVVMAGEYRARTETGGYQFDGSITYVDERDDANRTTGDQEFRGHIRGDGRFDIDRQWRWGFDLYRSTDDTYLQRYDISKVDTLTSTLFLEGFNGRNYASAKSFLFQDLREDVSDKRVPIIAPLLDYHFVGEPDRLGGRLNLDANGMGLFRQTGADSRRLSLGGGWQLPYLGPIGDVYRLTTELRGDLYWVDDVKSDDGGPGSSGNEMTGRIWPLAALEWRYPLVRNQGSARQLIEPIAELVLSPNGSNPDLIPNEDSKSFEFDDTNLFSLNRFPGLDRVESGSRLNYGVRLGAYGESGGFSNLVVGQSLRISDRNVFAEESALNDRLSDIVGRVTLAPADYLDYVFRFRLEPEHGKFRRAESYLNAGPEAIRVRLGYVFLARELANNELGQPEEIQPRREEIHASARVKLTEYWSAQGEFRRDLSEDDNLFAGIGLRYIDECFDFLAGFERRFTRDRDVEPSTNLIFRIRFKNLG